MILAQVVIKARIVFGSTKCWRISMQILRTRFDRHSAHISMFMNYKLLYIYPYDWFHIFQKSTIFDSNITPEKLKFWDDSSLLVNNQWKNTIGYLGITGITSKNWGDQRN